MDKLSELKIIMVAPRGVGKTSLLAAMHEEFDKTFDRAGLTTWTTDTITLDAIEDCKRTLRNMDYRLQNLVDPTDAKIDPWQDEGFVFELGTESKKFMRVRFTDPSGEYFRPDATDKQKEYVKEQLRQCDAVILPIDATALMEKKTGRTSRKELGTWHEEKNDPVRIIPLLKDAYENLSSPKLVILAPIKCETYMRTDYDANDLLEHVKIGYRELLDFLKGEQQYHKIALIVTPVQTIGNVVFSHAQNTDGKTKFFYNKLPINAPYAPKDGDQPLRYVLRFLLNVHNENNKLELAAAQAKLEELEKKVNVKTDKLTEAQLHLYNARRRVEKRNGMWFPMREIFNIFDDVHGSYHHANQTYNNTKKALNEQQIEKSALELYTNFTEAQIQAFNTAIAKFAVDCKQDGGFAILQGRSKWLPIPKS